MGDVPTNFGGGTHYLVGSVPTILWIRQNWYWGRVCPLIFGVCPLICRGVPINFSVIFAIGRLLRGSAVAEVAVQSGALQGGCCPFPSSENVRIVWTIRKNEP